MGDHYTNPSTNDLQISYSNIDMDLIGGGTANINSFPAFCNPDSGDFSLNDISPCVGTGANEQNMGAFNIGCEYFPKSIFISNSGNDFNGDGTSNFHTKTSKLELTMHSMEIQFLFRVAL